MARARQRHATGKPSAHRPACVAGSTPLQRPRRGGETHHGRERHAACAAAGTRAAWLHARVRRGRALPRGHQGPARRAPAGGAAPGEHVRGIALPRALPRGGHPGRDARRPHRPRAVAPAAARRDRPVAGAHERNRAHRRRRRHGHGAGRGRAAGAAGAARRAGADVPAGPRSARQLHDRRQHLDQRRRQPRDPLRHDARTGGGAGSGAGRRHRARWPEAPDQEQHRHRPQAAVHRQRRRARRRHACRAATRTEAGRAHRRVVRAAVVRRGALAAAAGAPAARRRAHGVRGDVGFVFLARRRPCRQGGAAGGRQALLRAGRVVERRRRRRRAPGTPAARPPSTTAPSSKR
jgi:hypothetical protein